MKKTITLLTFFIMIISVAYAADSHIFQVNKYYLSQAPQIKSQSFFIEPIESVQTVGSCETGNFSFRLNNPGKSRLFRFSVSDFRGIVYSTQELFMGAEDVRLISLRLQPDCSFRGTANPKVNIETDNEKASLPLILHVTGDELVGEENCLYHYNSTVCSSADYVRITQGRKYEVDLEEMFYDPDEDSLVYSAVSNNLDVKIKGTKATINPPWYYTGAEEVSFRADDGKGGKAYSRTYYFHVVSNERGMLLNFLLGNWIWFAVIAVLLLIILLLLVFK